MVILVDTNVILDVLLKRETYMLKSQIVIEKCANREVVGYLAAHSIPNLFYILRKYYTQEERRGFIKNLCRIFHVSELNEKKILSAAENREFLDFEDCLQEECAVEIMADYIVTRNLGDYRMSRVKAVTPEEFVTML